MANMQGQSTGPYYFQGHPPYQHQQHQQHRPNAQELPPLHVPPYNAPLPQSHGNWPYQPQQAMAPVMPPSPASAHGQGPVAPSPGGHSENHDDEERIRAQPGPSPVSHTRDGMIYALRVVQEPLRARMCGFGDKDRRPISAPPIVQLIIFDQATRKEIDYSASGNIEISHLVCMADIYDQKGAAQANLVQGGNGGSTSISSSIVTAYPASTIIGKTNTPATKTTDEAYSRIFPEEPRTAGSGPPPYINGQMNPMHPQYQNHMSHYQGHPQGAQYPSAYGAPPPHGQPPYGMPYGRGPPPGMQNGYHPQYNGYGVPAALPSPNENGASPAPNISRNLIGQTTSNCNRLQDMEDKWGLYFCFPDLSVRSEDWFRLKFSFLDIGRQLMFDPTPNATSGTHEGVFSGQVANSAPCLAAVWSNPFRVYSAKKFPGVADSTPLSKKFASQGLKISIRKDPDATGGKRKGKRKAGQMDGETDSDDDEE